MKKLGDIAKAIQPSNSTAVSIAREKPITKRLRGKRYGKVMPVYDGKGAYIGDTFELFETFVGKELTPQEVAAMNIPTKTANTITHLTSIAAHKPHGKGDMFEYFLSDMANMLSEYSEWAIFEACNQLKQSGGQWYPQTDTIINLVSKLNGEAQTLKNRMEKDNG